MAAIPPSVSCLQPVPDLTEGREAIRKLASVVQRFQVWDDLAPLFPLLYAALACRCLPVAPPPAQRVRGYPRDVQKD
jgi:hypothetical protein